MIDTLLALAGVLLPLVAVYFVGLAIGIGFIWLVVSLVDRE
jgi:hypothetical protein